VQFFFACFVKRLCALFGEARENTKNTKNTRSSQSIRAKCVQSVLSVFQLRQENIDETDSTNRHENNSQLSLRKGETFFAPPHSAIRAKSVQSVFSLCAVSTTLTRNLTQTFWSWASAACMKVLALALQSVSSVQ